MRVLYFSRDYTTHDRRFLARLVDSPHQVWYLRLENDGMGYEARPVPEGIREHIWRGGTSRQSTPDHWLQLMPHFEAVLNELRPDLVHAGPVQSCGFMAALSGFRPLLLMSWGADILVDAQRDEFWRWMTLYTLRHADLLLCDCAEVSERAQQLAAFPDNRIVQFPWGIDLECFAPGPDASGLRAGLGWEHAFVVISTRSWEEPYGVEVLLEAFRRAHAINSRVRLLLLGDGALAPAVRRFITDHRLSSAVHTPGLVPHTGLPDYFRNADLYVSAAHSDGTSISLLEALATGLPVVLTDRPSNREWVLHGENGWLARSGDAESFARLIVQAVDLDPACREAMSRANRRLAEQRADWRVNSAHLLGAYERLAILHG